MVNIIGVKPPPGAIVSAALLDTLRCLPDTDTGNAEAFALLYGHRFRFDHSRKRWMVWNGLCWGVDLDGEAERAAIDTVRWGGTVVRNYGIDETALARLEFLKRSESVYGIKATLDVAKNLRDIATVAADYDRDPFLLTVSNGTLDLRSGQLRRATHEDFITRATRIIYDPLERCPRWLRFLDEIFATDLELIEFIQRAAGYSLTGDTREQCMFILHGNGANGKSTFLETVRSLLGPHVTTTPFATLMSQRNVGAPRNDLAALVGARLVISSEAGQDSSLDEAVVKLLTGQDTISCRFLYGEYFEYVPQFKLWLATNYKPVIRGGDDAIWRRIRLVPFNQQFKGERRDSMLLEKLRMELPGILAWAVHGCLNWQKVGLGRPRTVLEATTEYRRESDQVGRFISERCVSGPELSVSGKNLYGAYVHFCQVQGEKPLANNNFAAQVEKRDFEKKRGRQGWTYLGLGLGMAGGN